MPKIINLELALGRRENDGWDANRQLGSGTKRDKRTVSTLPDSQGAGNANPATIASAARGHRCTGCWMLDATIAHSP